MRVWVPFCVVLPRVYSDSLCGSILSAGSRSELRGVDTRFLKCVGCYWDIGPSNF